MGQYFYHSFPKSNGTKKSEDYRYGVAILESILKNGLLLTPEVLEFTEERINGEPRISKATQCRACFTLINQSELKEHSKTFGSFSLEFETDILRVLGIMPVFYIPKLTGDKYGQIGAMIMNRIAEIQHILKTLHNLTDALDKAPEAHDSLVYHIDDKIMTYQLNTGELNKFIKDLPIGENIRELLAFIQSFANLFYPADNTRHDKDFDYYFQNEWRIGSNLATQDERLSTPLDNKQKEEITPMNPGFFQGILSTKRWQKPRIDMCELLNVGEEKTTLDLINKIYIPKAAKGFLREEIWNEIKDKTVLI